MLSESVPISARERRIRLLVGSEALAALLCGLLPQWGYELVATPAADEMLLVEEGSPVPADSRHVLRLTCARSPGSSRLDLPLPVEELWRQLGFSFHQTPRHHIRIPIQLPAILQARGESTLVQIVNLADMGARFDFPRELVNGEELRLQADLAGERLSLEGRVIYVISRGELEGTGRSEIGMVFDRTPPETRRLVREFIVWRYLAQARQQVPEDLFSQGLDFFQIPQAIRKRLEKV